MRNILCMYTEVVKFYPYRTARMVYPQIFMSLSRRSEDMEKLENYLAEKINVNRDNHTAYLIRNKEGKEMYIQFTDSKVNFGSAIIEEKW